VSARALVLLVALALAPRLLGQGDAERLKGAKGAFFDGRYAEARTAWQAIRTAGGADAAAAAYWVARCSEALGEHARALDEYQAFLAGKPQNRVLAEEARTGRIGLAAKLYKAGQKQHLGVLTDALADESRTVRFFAALQLGGLGAPAGLPAVAVLCEIVERERDEDLKDRARLALLRVDPKAMAGARCGGLPAEPRPATSPRRPPARVASFIRVRIYEHGKSQPSVSINLPLALGDLIFKSLPDETRQELRKKGYDADKRKTCAA
jgi:hypothetical protein